MAIVIKKPDAVFVQNSYMLYNAVKNEDLPAANGHYGVNDVVWNDLIDLTRTKCRAMNIPLPGGDMMSGLCIWASVVATKFCVLRNHALNSHMFFAERNGDGSGSNHYFVVSDIGGTKVICDITCNQFNGAPDYLVGRLSDIKGASKKVTALGSRLYDVYKAGAASSEFVI
ncbi:hypothetical protein [Aliiruegeria lutimaris]|uniref:Uncharacterized protein n=1 Tax=Aliiruegeria lutimaris TaxID=571298 RepID=A0A1G8J306_9RHOB|nr:hypothetical protein [Aliiruegeria lutimaris]SDI25347.1 hypothetical protein SAMN04488026_1001199 [Aliiruegeria lutimaris]